MRLLTSSLAFFFSLFWMAGFTFSGEVRAADGTLESLQELQSAIVLKREASKYPEFWRALKNFVRSREYRLRLPEIQYLYSLIPLADYGASFPDELLAMANNGHYLLSETLRKGDALTRSLVIAELESELEQTRVVWQTSAQARLLGMLAGSLYSPGVLRAPILRECLLVMLQSPLKTTRNGVISSISESRLIADLDLPFARVYFAAVERKWFDDEASQRSVRLAALMNELRQLRESLQGDPRKREPIENILALWMDRFRSIIQEKDPKILLEASELLRSLATLEERQKLSRSSSSENQAKELRQMARQADELLWKVVACPEILLGRV